jgi:hypothetical protein
MIATSLTDDTARHAGRYFGKYRGIVTAVEDAKHQGSVEVQVPSVLGPEAKVLARACMPYGHFYVPPVGTNVWVEFEAGDIGLPLWVGCWYPEGKAPVEAQTSPPDHRVIQTSAGHTIEISDHEGEEKILIRHAKDAFLSIDKDGSVLLSNPNGSHLHLDAKNKTTTLVEEHGNFLTLGEKGTSIVNPSGTLLDLTGDTVNVAAKKVVLQSSSVALGSGASDPTIMGTAFDTLWKLLLTHVHPSAVGPTGPAPTLAAAQLLPGVHLTSGVLVK